MSYIEKKWQANTEKVACAQAFPGRLGQWSEAEGKRLLAACAFGGRSDSAVLVFEGGGFVIASRPAETPATLVAALEAARGALEPFHAEAYSRLDALAERDRALTRLARMERIVDAVRNNLSEMPELDGALREVLGFRG